MTGVRYLCIVFVFLLVACGSRQSSQPVTQPVAQTAPQPVVEPKPSQVAEYLPEQRVAAEPQETKPPAEGVPADRVPRHVQQRATHSHRFERLPAATAAPLVQAERRRIVLPAGTAFDVRLEETLDTKNNRSGDRFTATLYRPIAVDGRVVLPRGTRCSGHLVESASSGRFKGRAVMSLDLDSFHLNGKNYEIDTSHMSETSGRHRKRNLALIGGGGGLGSAIGAIAAGPAGALIGAGAGAAAGTTGAGLTGKKNVRIPVETPLSFTLRSPVEI